IACRTIRRCTPYFFANPLIVSPAACPRRISSNSSTLSLLSIPEWFHSRGPGVGQIRRSKWAKLDERTQIMEVINAAGVKQIDHLIITHYHVDHIGGLEELAKRIEIKHYIDHGPTVEEREQVRDFQAKYAELYSKAKHTVVKPGDKIPFGPVDVTVVTSAKQVIKK